MDADRVCAGCVAGAGGDPGTGTVSAPKPPCARDCPRRRVQPNCHNRDYCPAWGKFEDEEAARKEALEKRINEERDAVCVMKASARRLAKRGGK